MNSAITNKHELENRISDLEASLTQLKTQLHHLEENDQHEAIDNLEVYLEQIDHKYEDLRGFWSIVVDEVQQMLGNFNNDDTSR